MGNCMANLRGGCSSDDELADQSGPHSSSFSADVARGTNVTDSANGAGSVHYGSGDQQQFVADFVPVSAEDVGSLAPPVDAIQQWGHDVVWLFSDEQQENANAFEERPYKIALFQELVAYVLEGTLFNLVAEASVGDFKLDSVPRQIVRSLEIEPPQAAADLS